MPFLVVSRCLGLLLLAAAALKLQGLGPDPAGRAGIFSTPEWQVGIVEMEILLGVWLLSGGRPIGSWMAALAAFSVFAAVTFYQGLIGRATCGCFGALSVSPWYAFAMDGIVLAGLAFARPDLKPLRETPRSALLGNLGPAACTCAGCALILAALSGAAYATFGSTGAAIAYLRGERISIYPGLLDLGQGRAGESQEASIAVQNWTDQPVRLIGGTPDCSCVVTDDLPVAIPPGKACTVTVRMNLPKGRGAFNRQATLLTDDALAPKLLVRLTGRIVPGEQLSAARNSN